MLAAILLALAPPVSTQEGLRAYYQDDFILETTNGEFQLRIRGNVHFDARFYQSEYRGAPCSFDIRRARIDLQGRIRDRFAFRLQPEFAGTPYIRNAWVDVRVVPAFHVQLGQMKVPFSTSWATLDNNVNFIERGAANPVFPFFDRGLLLWGEIARGALVYDVGVYNAAGVDLEVPAGDQDDHKDVVGRLFLRPFAHSRHETLRGVHVVLGGTWGRMSRPTQLETKGYGAANFESAIWRWRTQQLLGTDGRVTDHLTAEIDRRHRLGVELHYLLGSFVLSSEFLETHYRDIALYHDFQVGSARAVHDEVLRVSGVLRSWSSWLSLYLTGESKELTNQGWRTARPRSPLGAGGLGAWEILTRYSRTWSDRDLFTAIAVNGFAATDPRLPGDYTGSTPGAGNTVTATVLDGAHDAHEITVGLNWTLNPMVRIQLNDVYLWAPSADRNGDGTNDNLLMSGAGSGQVDPEKKSRKTRWEHAVMVRLIFKF